MEKKKRKVLVADDEEFNREVLQDFLMDDYIVDMAENGEEALRKIRQEQENYVAILLDLQMPKMNGYKVLEAMNEEKIIDKVPVLIITGEDSVKVEKQCFTLGVSDFIHKPFEPGIIHKRVQNITNLCLHQRYLKEQVEQKTLTVRKQYELLQLQAEQLKRTNTRIIDILGTVVEYRNLESGQHINRVKHLTEILARHAMAEFPEYHLTQDKIDMIVSASPLHDIGKIAIPDHVLLKPGRLTEEEFEIMKTHTTSGCSILESIKDVWDDAYWQTCYEICRSHHEKYDGRGYPDGLKGEEIPLSAQIVSIADVYDALVSKRVYKAAFTKKEAFEMIINGKCGLFSPDLLICFRNAREEFERLADE